MRRRRSKKKKKRKRPPKLSYPASDFVACDDQQVLKLACGLIGRELPSPNLPWPQHGYQLIEWAAWLSQEAKRSNLRGLLYRAKEILLRRLTERWLKENCCPANLIDYHFDKSPTRPPRLVLDLQSKQNSRSFHLRPGEEEQPLFSRALMAIDQIKNHNRRDKPLQAN